MHGYNFVVDFRYDSGLHTAAWLLQQSFRFPGYERRVSSLLAGSGKDLFILGCYLREQGIELPTGQVGYVSSGGGFTTARQRALARELFCATLIDTYSLTEVFAGARYCPGCNGYHFDQFVVDELLEVGGDRRVTEDVGEVVLTPLVPFTRRFLLVRYRTGDLAEAVRADCAAGDVTYRFKGRVANAVDLNGGGLWVGSGDVLNALDGIAEVRRPANPELTLPRDPTVGQWPIFNIEQDRQHGGLPNPRGAKLHAPHPPGALPAAPATDRERNPQARLRAPAAVGSSPIRRA